MLSFKQYLSEESKSLSATQVNQIEKLIKYAKKFGSKKIIWRSHKKAVRTFRGTRSQTSMITPQIEFVVNTKGRVVRGSRKNVYGPEDTMMTGIVQNLGLNYDPIFTTPESGVSIFGKQLVFIPAGAFQAYTHPKIKDMVSHNPFIDSGTDPAEVAKQYKSYNNDIPSGATGEVIFDAKGYYLLNPEEIIWRTTRSKYRKYTSEDQIKTYADVVGMLEEYLKLLNWATSKDYLKYVDKNDFALSRHNAKKNAGRPMQFGG